MRPDVHCSCIACCQTMQCFLQCISNQTKSTHLFLILWQVLVLYPSEFSYLWVVQTYFLTFSVKPFLHLPTYKNFERINRKMKYSFGQTTLPYRFSCASFFVNLKFTWHNFLKTCLEMQFILRTRIHAWTKQILKIGLSPFLSCWIFHFEETCSKIDNAF